MIDEINMNNKQCITSKNGSYIYTIPTADKPVRMVSDPPIIMSEEEYLKAIERLFENIEKLNGLKLKEKHDD